MTIDLTSASVRPAGSGGRASRTAAGFVLLTSPDGADLISFVDEHQREANLIEQLAAQIAIANPEGVAMVFTAGGEPYLLSWGQAMASVASPSARFTVAPVAGQLLVHPLAIDDESTVVLSTGSTDPGLVASPVNLAQGSIAAEQVTIDLTGRVPDVAPALTSLPVADAVPTAPEPDPSPESVEPFDAPAAPPAPAIEVPVAPVIEVPVAPAPVAETPVTEAAVMPDVPIVEPAPAAAPSAPSSDPAAEPIIVSLAPPQPDAPTFAPEPGPPAALEITFADDIDDTDAAVEPVEPVEPVEQTVSPEPAAELDFDTPDTTVVTRSAGDSGPIIPEVPPAFQQPVEPAVSPAPAAAEPPAANDTAGPITVLGIVCPHGHHNHPQATFCAHCGTKMGEHRTTVLVNGPRPPLGTLVADDGATVAIDGDLVLGRDPASHADVRSGLAGAMVLVDDSLALSRRHARIMLEEWSAFVSDLESSNGTWLNRGPNPQAWMQVEPGTSVALEPGDKLKVGGRIVHVELHHLR